MHDATDLELLRAYQQHGAEAAFATLVERHVSLVYSVALRHTGSAASAEEITQAVFIILSRKAASLRADTVLEGWLHATARLTALSFLRGERRRQCREQEANMQSTLHEPATTDAWPQLAPLLDEALAQLGTKDRDAVMLRFFKTHSVRDVATALNVNESAAQRRLLRAVDKLRKFFTQRGVTLSATVLTAAIAANSVQAAPVGLAKIISVAAVAKGAAAGTSTLTLVKGALKLMAWTKAKMVLAVGVGVLLAAGTTKMVVERIHAPDRWWDIDSSQLHYLPSHLVVRETHFAGKGGRKVTLLNGTNGWFRLLGKNQHCKVMLEDAYRLPSDEPTSAELFSDVRTVYPQGGLPQGEFDYLVTVPNQPREQLKAEIKRNLGLVAHRETNEMDAWVLRVKNPDAPGLRVPTDLNQNASSGMTNFTGLNISSIAWIIERRLMSKPIIDKTGMTNICSFVLRPMRTAKGFEYNEASYRKDLLNQLGLELVPSREPVEMLVVERVK